MKKRALRQRRNVSSTIFFSKWLLVISFILTMVGLFFVFEASTAESFQIFGHPYHFLQQQSFWLVLGWAGLLLAVFWPLSFWEKTSPILFVGGLILLLLVFIPGLGLELNGARRWISLGGINLQPIEFFKFSLVIFFASWMKKHQKIASLIFFTVVPALLILAQPDLGSLLVLITIALGMYFLAGGKLTTFIPVGIGGLMLLIIVILISPYRMRRLETFLNPESDPLGASFHIRQITLALGNGGLIGQGLGNSKQKYSYIPEASSDSIFAIVAEEVGLIGSSLIVLAYASYIFLAFKIAGKAKPRSFAQLAAFGVTLWIAAHLILNLAAVVALVPLTGLPLPFFSYGGSSLIMLLFVTGLLVRVEKETA